MAWNSTSRRQFTVGGLASIAFAGIALRACTDEAKPDEVVPGYGPLREDPRGLLDLPEGFTYRLVSRAGESMDDGFLVPDHFDGMGCIGLGGGRVALIRNHELLPSERVHGPTGAEDRLEQKLLLQPHFGRDVAGLPLPAGTTTIVYDLDRGVRESQYLSLAGTAINCAGGTTPWGSWLSCEEVAENKIAGQIGKDHGWVFDVPARQRGLVQPMPLRGLGRFRHEAAAVDPATGIVYLTEDQDDGLFYRFLPSEKGRPGAGGRLQALGLRAAPRGADTRNWASADMKTGTWQEAFWIDLAGVDNPHGDLRMRGHAAGAALFARGEGIHCGSGELYFTCTNGGAGEIGQVMRYQPSPDEGSDKERQNPGQLQLFVEARDPERMNYVDNLTIAPWGHLIACEDRDEDGDTNHLVGVTSEGGTYTIARCRVATELAGACFAPDRSTLFLNLYSPGATLAVTGPWDRVRVT